MFIMSTIMSSIVFCNVMTCQYDSLSIVDKIDVCRMTPPAADDDPILGCHHRLTDRPRLLILQQIIHLRLSFMTQVTGGTDRSHCRHNYVDMVVVDIDRTNHSRHNIDIVVDTITDIMDNSRHNNSNRPHKSRYSIP